MLRRALVSRLTVPAAVLLLGGCGNSRTPAPNVQAPAPAGAVRALSYPTYGISLQVPRNWVLEGPGAPLLATVSSGKAVVALWSYPRAAPPPAGAAALALARVRLIAATERSDRGLRLIHAKVIQVDHHAGIELDALERISGQPRRVRSVHVFTAHAEVVLDAYAPPEIFHPVDHDVFSPLKRSLRLHGTAAA